MPQLPSLICPSCHLPIACVESAGKVPVATQFDDCLRHCEPCAIGASNASDRGAVTFIHRDPLGNIPVESREGASEALAQAQHSQPRIQAATLRLFHLGRRRDLDGLHAHSAFRSIAGRPAAGRTDCRHRLDGNTDPPLVGRSCRCRCPWKGDPRAFARAVRRPARRPKFVFRAGRDRRFR